MNDKILNDIKTECEEVSKNGHGVVSVKIKNGAVYLIESTISRLYDKPLDNKPDKVFNKTKVAKV